MAVNCIVRPRASPQLHAQNHGGRRFFLYRFFFRNFQRRFLRQNVPQAESGRAGGVELYTKCTEKQRFEDISVFFDFWSYPSIWDIQPNSTPLFRVIRSLILWCFYSLKIHRFFIFVGSRICESLLKKTEQNSANLYF